MALLTVPSDSFSASTAKKLPMYRKMTNALQNSREGPLSGLPFLPQLFEDIKQWQTGSQTAQAREDKLLYFRNTVKALDEGLAGPYTKALSISLTIFLQLQSYAGWHDSLHPLAETLLSI